MPGVNRDPLVELPAELLRGVPPSASAERGTDARYVLGVDGGATKTLAAVLDLQSGALHLGRGGPSNEDAVGARRAVKALLKAADQALARAGIGQDELAAAVLGLAGTDTEAIARSLRAKRDEDWIVVGDVVAAWGAATGARAGVGVISGTGSNVFGVGGRAGTDIRAWRAGGWGHLLGDEGSGYWLGAQSIRAALHDRDGSGPETALSDTAPAFFGLQSVEQLATHVYSKPLTKGEIAALATETARLAEAGDAVARELYEQGARELGRQIAAVIERTGLTGSFPVGLIGSAFKAGAVFVQPLTAAVHEHAPEARVVRVHMQPVGGSLLLAMRACGREGALPGTEIARLIDEALAAPTSG